MIATLQFCGWMFFPIYAVILMANTGKMETGRLLHVCAGAALFVDAAIGCLIMAIRAAFI